MSNIFECIIIKNIFKKKKKLNKIYMLKFIILNESKIVFKLLWELWLRVFIIYKYDFNVKINYVYFLYIVIDFGISGFM